MEAVSSKTLSNATDEMWFLLTEHLFEAMIHSSFLLVNKWSCKRESQNPFIVNYSEIKFSVYSSTSTKAFKHLKQ